jgi:hypothetical protein
MEEKYGEDRIYAQRLLAATACRVQRYNPEKEK